MKFKIILGLFGLIAIHNNVFAQTYSGKVMGGEEPLFGANVYTEDALVGTTTDLNGNFTISLPEDKDYHELHLSYIGFEVAIVKLEHTMTSAERTNLLVSMEASAMEDVVIEKKKFDRSMINPLNIETIDSKELCKAACCNLSESFETNATVDVSFSDAVTGAKKIKMLGIDGYYTQTLFENSVGIRGLGNAYGMLFVPGPFMTSIAINKGSGSVVNGYEGITGQINFDYKKPENSERFYLNLFGSRHGQFELNTNASHRFNENLSTMIFAQGVIHKSIHDENHDGFQDVPLNERVVLMNRWHFKKGKRFIGQASFSYIFDDREGGQLSNFFSENQPEKLYGIETVTRKYDAFAKTGFIFKNESQSIGVLYRYTHHEQDSYYGNRLYNGREDFANLNFIFQTGTRSPKESLKLGMSYQYDNFEEQLDSISLDRRESVPGFFAEYAYQDNEKLAVLLGLRADMHNTYGAWFSPKVHVKYSFNDEFSMKLSAGKGYRTANIIAENMGALASAREYVIQPNLGYESAWNAGIGFIKQFDLGFQPGSITIDYYRTDFTNQVVVDFENPREVAFYDLDGKSYSNSFQIEAEIDAADNFEIKFAYKLDDVVMNYKSGLKRVPYIPRHKLLLTLNYETPNEKWRFDVTGKVNTSSRIPSTEANPQDYQRALTSPAFFTLNSQITAVVKKWEFYVGGENLTNYWQQDPVIASESPFGRFFDSSMIWGPIGGTRLYLGLRYTLPYQNKKETISN